MPPHTPPTTPPTTPCPTPTPTTPTPLFCGDARKDLQNLTMVMEGMDMAIAVTATLDMAMDIMDMGNRK